MDDDYNKDKMYDIYFKKSSIDSFINKLFNKNSEKENNYTQCIENKNISENFTQDSLITSIPRETIISIKSFYKILQSIEEIDKSKIEEIKCLKNFINSALEKETKNI